MKKLSLLIIAALCLIGCERNGETSDINLPFVNTYYEYTSVDSYYEDFYFGIDRNDNNTHFLWHFETGVNHQEAYWKLADNTHIIIYRGNDTLYNAEYNQAYDQMKINGRIYIRKNL